VTFIERTNQPSRWDVLIDNRREKMADHINLILETSEVSHFAIEYFYRFIGLMRTFDFKINRF
jgi:hypothetical protein